MLIWEAERGGGKSFGPSSCSQRLYHYFSLSLSPSHGLPPCAKSRNRLHTLIYLFYGGRPRGKLYVYSV